MPMTFTVKGDFKKSFGFFKNAKKMPEDSTLMKYAELGLQALIAGTPRDTGITAESWYYEIERSKSGASINFCNSNAPRGVKVALLLQYGHATRDGGWVEGVDYINPALKPVFDKLADDAWKEVTR